MCDTPVWSSSSCKPWENRRFLSRSTSAFSSLISLALGSSLITALQRICLARSAYLETKPSSELTLTHGDSNSESHRRRWWSLTSECSEFLRSWCQQDLKQQSWPCESFLLEEKLPVIVSSFLSAVLQVDLYSWMQLLEMIVLAPSVRGHGNTCRGISSTGVSPVSIHTKDAAVWSISISITVSGLLDPPLSSPLASIACNVYFIPMAIISISIRTSLLTILHLSIVELYFTSCLLVIMILKQQSYSSACFPHPGFPLIARWEQSLCREWSHFFSSCCSAVDNKTAGCGIQTNGHIENKFPHIINNKWPTISANADITFPSVVRDLLMFAPSCTTISQQFASETKYRIQSIK